MKNKGEFLKQKKEKSACFGILPPVRVSAQFFCGDFFVLFCKLTSVRTLKNGCGRPALASYITKELHKPLLQIAPEANSKDSKLRCWGVLAGVHATLAPTEERTTLLNMNFI